MRRTALVAGVSLVLLSLALLGTARAEDARVYVAAYAGLAFPEELENITARPSGAPIPNLELAEFGDDKDHKFDGTIMGGKLGFIPERDFTWFGLEAEVFVAPNRIKPGQTGAPASWDGEELTTVTVAFNSILRWPKGPLQPYVGVGPSIVWSDGIGGEDSAFGLNALAGMRILLGSRLFIFGEAKFNQSKLDFPGASVKLTQRGLVAGVALAF